jgi:hypothetical protein
MAFIVKPGADAFQLPARLITFQTTADLDGTSRRVLATILSEAARRELWPSEIDDLRPISMRLHAADLRAGAGLSTGGYDRLYASLERLERAQIVIRADDRLLHCPIIADVARLPGNHVDLTVSEELSALH